VVKLNYSSIASLDGYAADAHGRFDWAAPDDEVHAFVNDLERPIGTYLYGRRMYQVMAAWETMDAEQPVARDFAGIWRAADKIVYSRTLDAVSTPRTRLEREFDPGAVRQLKETASSDLSIGGPGLAAEALAAGLVDEYHVFVTPAVVGGGTQSLPAGVSLQLELLDERRFGSGVVYLRYAVGGPLGDGRERASH
jgi:dihydrofolate reductase